MSGQKKESEPKKGSDLGLLEEDDEFEEFPAEEWSGGDKEPEIFWEEKWDDDNIEDDFSNQLKALFVMFGTFIFGLLGVVLKAFHRKFCETRTTFHISLSEPSLLILLSV
ncbi:unnamed protein product [Clavelina lepadiformis]|uniref:26S proteasome complex subunit SEM1 n=1 Tax=Clavelina lepadiformis TaxID=159417 RepID=A0ABP0EZR6_CLALP